MYWTSSYMPYCQVGELVLWDLNTHFKGNRKKFGPHYGGPYEVIKVFPRGNTAIVRSLLPRFRSPKMASIYNPLNAQNNFGCRLLSRDKVNALLQEHNASAEEGAHLELYHPADYCICFEVNRSQVKPYYKSYEYHLDGLLSPFEVIIEHANDEIVEAREQSQLIEVPHRDQNDPEVARLVQGLNKEQRDFIMDLNHVDSLESMDLEEDMSEMENRNESEQSWLRAEERMYLFTERVKQEHYAHKRRLAMQLEFEGYRYDEATMVREIYRLTELE